MAPPTIRTLIKNCLKNLTAGELDEFKDALIVDKGVPTSSVEGKDFLAVTKVIDTTFGDEALEVVIELLNDIGCKKKAAALESRTRIKDSVDNGDPALPRTSSGELETEPSQEALKIAADRFPLQATGKTGPVKEPKEVKADAEALIRSEGGYPFDERLVLSRFIIQFGQYKGQTFKWLLENHVGYAVFVVATHQDERKWKKDQSPLMVHKDSLTQYTIAYAEVLKEVRLYPVGKGQTRTRVQSTRGQPSTSSSSWPTQGKQKRSWKKKSSTPYTRY